MKRLLIGLVALWVALPVAATKWAPVTISTDSEQVWVDRSSIVWHASYVRAWFLWDFPAPQTTSKGKSFVSMKLLSYFNCSLRQLSSRQVLYYDHPHGIGQPVESYAYVIEQVKLSMQDVVPDTSGEQILNYVCNNAPKSKTKSEPESEPNSEPKSEPESKPEASK
jgi:hypothetical protein